MGTQEELEAQIREMPLAARIIASQNIIGKLCSEGRCPKMSVPVRAHDEDIFIVTTLKDCLALVSGEAQS